MAPLCLAEFPRWSYFSGSHLDEEQGKGDITGKPGHRREVASLGNWQ